MRFYLESISQEIVAQGIIHLPNIIASLLIIFFVYLFYNSVLKFSNLYISDKLNQKRHIINFVKRFAAIFCYIIAIIAILGSWGFNIIPLITGVSLIFISVVILAKNSLSNIFSGFDMMFNKHLNIGDNIYFENKNGKIHDITLRNTLISLDDSDSYYVVPNSVFQKHIILIRNKT